jgi:hypothetical protein
LGGGSYKAFIDGGAANEQRTVSLLRLSDRTATRLVRRDEGASLELGFGLAVEAV